MGFRVSMRSPVHRPRLIHKPGVNAGPVRVRLNGASVTAGPVRISTHRNRPGSSSSSGAARQTAKDGASAGGSLVLGFGIFAVVAIVLWKYVLVWPHTLVVALGGPDELGWSFTIGGWVFLGFLALCAGIGAQNERTRKRVAAREAVQEAAQEATASTEAVDEPEPMPEPAPAVTEAPECAQSHARFVPTTPEQRDAKLTPHQQAQVDAYRRWQQRGQR